MLLSSWKENGNLRQQQRLLEEVADPASFVDTEVSFRPLPEYELWVADVVYQCRDFVTE